MLFDSKLWEAVALGITAENRKIEIFIKHNLSRGIARENQLRTIIVQHTRDPFKARRKGADRGSLKAPARPKTSPARLRCFGRGIK